jgi:hypothetical protein
MTITNTEQGNIVDLGGGDKMNAGVAPTTTSTVAENSVSPNTTYTMPPNNPQPTQNTAPNAPTQGAPTQGAPSQNATAPKTGQPTQPHPLSRIYDGILRNLSVPVTVTDPVTGQRRDVPQTRGQMGKSILAAALSGLMAPTAYRETPYGPVVDTGNTIAGAAKAGQEYQEKRQAKAQQLTNEQQAAKLMTIQNNFKLLQLQTASAHAKHEMLQENLANANVFNKPLTDLDALRADNPNVPQAFSQNGLTAAQILQGGHKVTDSNIVMTGVQPIWNEALGVTEDEPTYGVLNPDLQNITLPKEVTDKLAEMNSQWQDIHKVVGGNVRVPVNAYVNAMHDYQAVTQGQNTLENLSKAIGGKNVGNLAAAVKTNPRMISALYAMTQAGAAGHTADNRPENLLDVLLKTPGGSDVLNLMGLTPEQASNEITKIQTANEAKHALAKEGGMGDKSPAPEGVVPDLVQTIQNSDIPEGQKQAILGDVPELHGGISNRKQASDLRNRFLTAAQAQVKNNIQSGDPAAIANQARLTIGAGDITNAKDIYTARANVKAQYNAALEQKAIDLGLDPNHFNVEALKQKAATQEAFAPSGKIGQQLGSFKTFGEHVAGAKEASDAWKRSGSPLINKPLGWFAKNAANDPNYTRFVTSIIAPAKEYMNFLNQNRAEHEADIAGLERVLNPDQTADAAYAALQEFVRGADDRALSLGEQYRDQVGTTNPNLVSKATVDNFAKLGVQSRAAALSQTLPRAQSWVSNLQPQMLTKTPQDVAIAQQFYRAAGNDVAKMQSMAKEHGYIINVQ